MRVPRTILLLGVVLALSGAAAASLESEVGRSETRVESAAFPLVAGMSVAATALPERLERSGYRRVHARPERPGEYFFGNDVFWFYRRAHRLGGRDYPATLVGLALEDGRIRGAAGAGGRVHPLDREGLLWVDPETLSESLAGDRADRLPVSLETLPEIVWRAVLAAEDARFYDHAGVDARSIARAALANARRGGIAQGGSTITQQLVKNRDLTPKRSVGRKASEALRALALEAEYDKDEILEAYLNTVYLGHVDGLAVHGIGAAARAWLSKSAADLDLAEAALLAGMIQGPNRLAPDRHPAAARERRDWVLSRLEALGQIDAERAQEARESALAIRKSTPARSAPVHFLGWIRAIVEEESGRRLARGRGVVVETTLDPWLQAAAQRAVASHLDDLRRRYARLRSAPLSAALVALDARTGEILAYVGGNPDDPAGGFDRVRGARRQPGSTVKPFVLLEAFERCGERDAVHPATRVLDEPVTWKLPSGPWSPENADGRWLGVVDLRTALADSRNVPIVRIARWCGLEATAERFREVGLAVPRDAPPSLVLGAVETTPLDLARAYSIFANPGRTVEPFPVRRVERPGGRPISRGSGDRNRVTRASTAWLVRDLLRSAVDEGTARAGRIAGVEVAAKTGTTSGRRDAWFAGVAGPIVTVVWVGRDDGGAVGLTGSSGAGPLWRRFMEDAVPARPPWEPPEPRDLVEGWVDPESGLRVREEHPRAVREVFRRGALPPRKRWWRVDRATPVVR